MEDSKSDLFASGEDTSDDKSLEGLATQPSLLWIGVESVLSSGLLNHRRRHQSKIDGWHLPMPINIAFINKEANDDNSNFTPPWFNPFDDEEDVTMIMTATIDGNRGTQVEIKPDHGVARRAAAMEQHQEEIDRQCEATDFTNIGPMPNKEGWERDSVPTMDQVIQEMRDLYRSSGARSMFHQDDLPPGTSSDQAVLLLGRARQIQKSEEIDGSPQLAPRKAIAGSTANPNFFQNLALEGSSQPIDPNIFDTINSFTVRSITTMDNRPDTIFDTAVTNDTDSSLDVMQLKGTLHHQYIPMDVEDFMEGDDDDPSIMQPTLSFDTATTASGGANCRTSQLMIDVARIKTLPEEATQTATESSGKILDVWSVRDQAAGNDGTVIIEINHMPVSCKSPKHLHNAPDESHIGINSEAAPHFFGIYFLAVLSLLILLPGVLCLLPTPTPSAEDEMLYIHGIASVQDGMATIWDGILQFHTGFVMLGEALLSHPSIPPAIFSWFICWIIIS